MITSPFATGNQPGFMILAIISCVAIKKWPDYLVYLSTAAIFAFTLALFDLSFTALRACASYFVLPLTLAIIPKFIASYSAQFKRLLVFSIFLWLSLGLYQNYFDSYFLSEYISGGRTTAERGVFSFAPEPSYYGLTMVFYLLISAKLLSKRTNIIVIPLIIFQIVFLSKSFLAIASLIIIIGYYIIFVQKMVLIMGLLSLNLFLLLRYWSDYILYNYHSRYIKLLYMLIENPINLFKRDESGNDRIGHIFASFYGFLKDFGMPHGFSSYPAFIEQYIKILDFFSKNNYFTSGRIMSFYGTCLFELGIIGLLIIIAINKIIIFCTACNKEQRWFWLASLNSLLLLPIPLGSPLVGLVLATLIVTSKAQTRELSQNEKPPPENNLMP